MEYREVAPASTLRRWVRCYWLLSGPAPSAPAARDPALPDGCPELIINLADPFVGAFGDAPPVAQPSVMLVGQITRPICVAPTGRIDLVAVRFEPHGAATLGQHMATLTNRWVDAALFDGIELPAVLSTLMTADPEARVTALNETFHRITAAGPLPDPRVEAAVRKIQESHGTISLERLTSDLGTSGRTLQRRFGAEVGVSPKTLARIVRFQRVMTASRDEPGRLARVAAECGYSDQAHLIRDFRQLAAATPAAFLANPPAFTTLFTHAPHRRG